MHGEAANDNPYFYPRPPWGGRHEPLTLEELREIFLSTPSVGRATLIRRFFYGCFSYFYPRPPWGGRHVLEFVLRQREGISIHALRGEGDAVVDYVRIEREISIHALRGEGDCKSA